MILNKNNLLTQIEIIIITKNNHKKIRLLCSHLRIQTTVLVCLKKINKKLKKKMI